MELELKKHPNLWLECLEQTLEQTLAFCTTVVVLKMDFDKSVIKNFMSENQNHWIISVFEIETTGDSWFETLEESLDRKKFAHKRKFLWQIVRFVLCITKLTVQILHKKSITLVYHNIQLDFSPYLRLWFFPRKFLWNPDILKDVAKSIQFTAKKITKVQKIQKVFSVLIYLDTQIQILQKYRFGSSYESIKKVKVLRVKDFVGEKNLGWFSASEFWQLQNYKTC